MPKYFIGRILRLKEEKEFPGMVRELEVMGYEMGHWIVLSTQRQHGFADPGPCTEARLDEYYEPV